MINEPAGEQASEKAEAKKTGSHSQTGDSRNASEVMGR